ncbi:unnamed protein product [Allacma fusca]|uniref:Uncharacterized protein n=1 Tax=Allacma fusca TaxID=39272 RepID=A0A8J2PS75_9HEXA|nr:unnamed protein product [Allacma fusca]
MEPKNFARIITPGYLVLGILASTASVFAKIEISSPATEKLGGLKLVIDNAIYSFTTDVCSGGVFFKDPVLVEFECIHGYYLARPNGCSMEGSYIAGGSNYACQKSNAPDLIQAFIPVTNPMHPLDHTIALYDEPDTLKNFRRYTVDEIKGSKNEDSYSPVGAIVTNSQKSQKVNIGSLCYEGKTRKAGYAHMGKLRINIKTDDPKNRKITPGCNIDSLIFPWGDESSYNFSPGSTDSELFGREKMAALPKPLELSEAASLKNKFEIWGGLAYCLQANITATADGSFKMEGVQPSIESLKMFCPMSKIVREKRQFQSMFGGRGAPWRSSFHGGQAPMMGGHSPYMGMGGGRWG